MNTSELKDGILFYFILSKTKKNILIKEKLQKKEKKTREG